MACWRPMRCRVTSELLVRFFSAFLVDGLKMGKHPGWCFFFAGVVGWGGSCVGVFCVDVSGKNSETRIWKRFHGLRLFRCRLKHPSVTHFLTSVSYLIISSMSLPAVKGIVATAFYALARHLLKPTECSDVMWGQSKTHRTLSVKTTGMRGSDLFRSFFKTGMDGRHGRWSIFFSSHKWMIKFRPKNGLGDFDPGLALIASSFPTVWVRFHF